MGAKYKLKTNRGAAKRFKKTGTGKIRFRRANRNHIKTKQSTKRVRNARRNGVMCDSDAKLVHRMLPND
ncbi:MAG: 50S ribosomal protein L35 [Gammaproteobacteria bacterium 39-13]|nr:50S ribosomal protein L35 [Gammaproteobacteria bacterium]OJV94369.1 MAG: 50S ribosomal protein L35 [Gammaproteobacteria bacterium 39-13]